MTVWVNNSFEGYYPVGTAAVVVADTAEEAARFLEIQLRKAGLHQKVPIKSMEELPLITGNVAILADGDY